MKNSKNPVATAETSARAIKESTLRALSLLTLETGATGEQVRQAMAVTNRPTFWHFTRMAERYGFEYDSFWGDDGILRYRLLRTKDSKAALAAIAAFRNAGKAAPEVTAKAPPAPPAPVAVAAVAATPKAPRKVAKAEPATKPNMKQRLESQISDLESILAEIEQKTEGAKGKTFERYESAGEEVQTAISALGDALAAFD
jgi:hypothetical protein